MRAEHTTAPRGASAGALAAGFGLGLVLATGAATAATAAESTTTVAAADVPQQVTIRGSADHDATSLRAATSGIGKGRQALRDIPQSVTVLTEHLLDDRRIDTVKEALHQAAGISFQAAEGGEEDIRLRGFSLATTGDIRVDGLRDPAFYDRDTFAFDRIEVLRGSASMLFGRGSTGGVVNQATKQATLRDATAIDLTAGNGGFARVVADLNRRAGEHSAWRLNLMDNRASQWGNFIDKQGLAATWREGIGQTDEVEASVYHLHNHNGIHYGLPWLRLRSDQGSANPSGLLEGVDPRNYYGAASDHNDGSASHGTLAHTHRFDAGRELKTVLRHGRYDRDQRASSLRFCVAPTCAGFSLPGLDGPVRATDATPLTRGTNNKVQDLTTTLLQSDYSGTHQALGRTHRVLAGVDLAREVFNGYATVLPAGVVLDKNAVRTTLGTPDDGGGWVDESLRERRRQAAFTAESAGVYAQDMVHLDEQWKLVAGLRWDAFHGRYATYQTASGSGLPAVGTETATRSRSDRLWSHRVGLLYQPDDAWSWHASYGTSFNTSGDAYQYDAPGANTPPEGSRNLELGVKADLLDGRLALRGALFHAVKTNERNRDSPNGTPLDDYLLSGRRHAAGAELEFAGRLGRGWELFASYCWIPSARIDAGNADGTTLTGEQVGQRPSMTPRHSGTVWLSWQASSAWRVGAGLNARSSQTPNRNPAGIVAPSYVTADLLVEYTVSDTLSLKFNAKNLANTLYADALYSAHYVPGAPRSLQLTASLRY